MAEQNYQTEKKKNQYNTMCSIWPVYTHANPSKNDGLDINIDLVFYKQHYCNTKCKLTNFF